MPHTVHTHSETERRSTPVASKASSCGCGSHQETCCQLDCLIQPSFFGGQLLADTDLTQLLTWSKDKFRLARFRHGWGVVCGLEVQCDSGSQAVRVGPGYAIDCCGNDILVCEDATVSLDDACISPADPCATPEKRTTATGVEEGEKINFFGCLIPKAELREKILTIRYDESPSDFQTALGYTTSSGEVNCQPSRTRESFTLKWVDPFDSQAAVVEHWRNEYDSCREVVDKYSAWYRGHEEARSMESSEDRWQNIRNWILQWIDGTSGLDAHPLHQFCWLRDCLSSVDVEIRKAPDLFVSNILFWLVQDCRNHALSSRCSHCADDQGVPLARVYLWVPRREPCKVLAIDPYPPHRRPLSLDSWPTLPGWVNVGPAIWQSPEHARDLLKELGLTVADRDTPFQISPDPYTLYKDLACDLFVRRDEPVRLQVFDTQGLLGRRVVGVCGTPGISASTGAAKEEFPLASAAAPGVRIRDDELPRQPRERGPTGPASEVVEDVTESDSDATKTPSGRPRRRR